MDADPRRIGTEAMIEPARMIETAPPDGASDPLDAPDDRSMRIVEWVLSGIALLAALALALVR
jgi:hypothetical protein